jgi:hypothetical protein
MREQLAHGFLSSIYRFFYNHIPAAAASQCSERDATIGPDPHGGSQSRHSEIERLEMWPTRASGVAINGVPAKTVTISSQILEVAHSERLAELAANDLPRWRPLQA